MADKLAGAGRVLRIPYECTIDKYEFLPIFKHKIISEFQLEWKHLLNFKGSCYRRVQTDFTCNPLYLKFSYQNRRYITSIIRMRTDQNISKIGIRENHFCECGNVRDLSHILFECRLTFLDNLDLYN